MSASIDYLPIWKKNATSAERFYELALVAQKHPERFGKIAVIYEEDREDGRTQVRQISNNCDTTQLLGLLQLGIDKVLKDTSK